MCHSRPRLSNCPAINAAIIPATPDRAKTRPTAISGAWSRSRTISGTTIVTMPPEIFRSEIETPSPRRVGFRKVYLTPSQASTRRRPVEGVAVKGSGAPIMAIVAAPNTSPMRIRVVAPPTIVTSAAESGGPRIVATR